MVSVLSETISLCPVCLERVDARYVQDGDTVYMEKACPSHGAFRTKVWKGEPSLTQWYRESDNVRPRRAHTPARLGCPYDCGLCNAHEQAACCVVMDVTNACDLGCPVCLADAGRDSVPPLLAEIAARYDMLLEESEERPYNIQLSGGEPSTRRDICDIIAMGKKKGFPYIQLNTNGLRLASEPGFAHQLKGAGLDCAFLQFDGVDDAAYIAIRGRALMAIKERALQNCLDAGLGVTFVSVIVPGVNDHSIGALVDYAIARAPAVRGIHFQPVGYMGRITHMPADEDRFTVPELLSALEAQTAGRMRREHFLPLVSGHCMCSFHGNFLLQGGMLLPLSEEPKGCCCKQNSIVRSRDYIAKKWRTAPDAPKAAGDMGGQAHMLHRQSFSITAMAFMDAWTIDLGRLKKCRVQVTARDRRLMPQCAYNLTAINGDRLYGRN